MAENFMKVLKQEWYAEDSKALANQLKEHESTLRLKRRWLMDLPFSEKEQKKIDKLLPPDDQIMPESFLREDDVGYEDIKTCIETAFGAHNSREEPICVQDDVTILNLCDGFGGIYFLLDAMNNKGLCSFAKILSGGLVYKTNLSMRRAIRELLPKVIAEKNDISRTKLKRCSLLLKDPTNFHGNQIVRLTASESYHAAARKVLDGLEDFPSRTLRAMHRKLKGVKGYVPSLVHKKSGWSPGNLISIVRKRCMEMLSSIGIGDEPAEQLAGALGVAGLTLKLIMNCPDVRDFRRFSPEMDALHIDIAKAIHLLNKPKKVSLIELKKVQLLLDPNFELSARSLRMAVRNLLIEYLYECSDMDGVPDVLIQTLDIINGRAQLKCRKKNSLSKGFSCPKELMKEEIEKEIQHILNISAQAKEVVANLLPEHEFDEQFAHAYMDDYDRSDTKCVFDDDQNMEDNPRHLEFSSYGLYDRTESIGEINPVEFSSPVSRSKRDGCSPLSMIEKSDMDPVSMHLQKMNSNGICDFFNSQSSKDSKVLNNQCLGKEYPPGSTVEEFVVAHSDSTQVTTKPSMFSLSHTPSRKPSHNELKSEETSSCSPATRKNGFSGFKLEETDIVHQHSRPVNEYLELQEACDTTSMAAYHFVGYMLDTLAKTEGLELYQGDRLYLKGHTSVAKATEEFSGTLLSSFSKMWKKVLED